MSDRRRIRGRDSYSPSPPRKRSRRDDADRSPVAYRDRHERSPRSRHEHESPADREARRERKKAKKEKKEKRKAEKKEKKKRKMEKLKQQAEHYLSEAHAAEPPRGSPPDLLITDENYYSHNREFRYWLKHTQKTTWDDLTNNEARAEFHKFVQLWNAGDLAERYYNGDLASSTRSASSWVPTNAQPSSRPPPERSSHARTDRPPASSNDQYDREEQWSRLRHERKQYRKHNQMVEEELVPKPVGKEAMLDKKKTRAAQNRAERDHDPSYSDDFLMGSDDSFAAIKRQQQRREAQQEARRQDRDQQREDLRAKYRAREEALLDSFRAKVAQGDIPLMQQPR